MDRVIRVHLTGGRYHVYNNVSHVSWYDGWLVMLANGMSRNVRIKESEIVIFEDLLRDTSGDLT